MTVARVVEVVAPESGRRGSGYLIDDRLVLTAGHVVDGAPDKVCRVRALDSEAWDAARVVWRGESCDAALVELTVATGQVRGRARLGRIAGRAPVAVDAIGFPDVQTYERAGATAYDTEQILGTVRPLSRFRRDRLVIDVTGSAPVKANDASSPWAGASGAAVLSHGLLVGVLCGDPSGWGGDRLDATPITAIAGESGFRARFLGSADSPVGVEAIEATAALAPPVESLAREDARDAPSSLLHPQYGVVDFRGRAQDLVTLDEWAHQDRRLAIAVLGGRGGSGKSRLARHFAQQLSGAGWVTGMLRYDATAAEHAALVGLDAPVLAVVDYAENRREHVVALIDEFADAVEESQLLRVLLIARRIEGEWWTDLSQQAHSVRARAALAAAHFREVGAAEPSPGGREAAFLAAQDRFAAVTGAQRRSSAPDLSDPLFETVLFIHLAALGSLSADVVVCEGCVPADAPRPIREDLLDDALEREGRYWRASTRAAGLRIDDAVRRRVVAVATLTTPNPAGAPADEAATARLLAAVPDLERPACYAVARWLRGLYPTFSGWIAPLEPDLLGEALVRSVVSEMPSLADRLLDSDATAARLLTVLARIARDDEASARLLGDLLERRLADLCWTAIAVAEETGRPMGALLAAAFDSAGDADLAAEVESSLTVDTVELRELAVVATRKAIASARNAPQEFGLDGYLAALYNNFAIRLNQLGELQEALRASDEAVGRFRRLAEDDPDRFLSEVVSALVATSTTLADLGRWDDSLAAVEESVAIARSLDPRKDGARGALAMSLTSSAHRYGDLDRWDDARGAAEEALAIRRELATVEPGKAADDALANSLNSLSAVYHGLGRDDEALAAIEECAAIRRRMALEAPTSEMPALATCLHTLAVVLSAVGRQDEALDVAQAAATIHRELGAALPTAFGFELAASLDNLSGYLHAARRLEDALAANEEAITIFRRLADERPAVNMVRLAGSLSNRSALLGEAGDHEAGVAAGREAAAILRELAVERRAVVLPDLGACLVNLSSRLVGLGELDEAIALNEEAVDIFRELTATNRAAFAAKLAAALIGLSLSARAAGRYDQEKATNEEAVGLYRDLADERPGLFERDLAQALTNLAVDLIGEQRIAEALRTAEEAADIYRRLAAAQHDVSPTHLAVALNAVSICLDSLERRYLARATCVEAMNLLLPHLEQAISPTARAAGLAHLQHYVALCERQRVPLDRELTARMTAALASAAGADDSP